MLGACFALGGFGLYWLVWGGIAELLFLGIDCPDLTMVRLGKERPTFVE